MKYHNILGIKKSKPTSMTNVTNDCQLTIRIINGNNIDMNIKNIYFFLNIKSELKLLPLRYKMYSSDSSRISEYKLPNN